MSHSKTLNVCCGPVRLDNTRGSSMGLRKYLDFSLLIVMISCMALALSRLRLPTFRIPPTAVGSYRLFGSISTYQLYMSQVYLTFDDRDDAFLQLECF